MPQKEDRKYIWLSTKSACHGRIRTDSLIYKSPWNFCRRALLKNTYTQIHH